MENKSKPIPEGYQSVTPYLNIDGAEKAIEFYKKVFNAKEVGRIKMGPNKIGHAELLIGDSKIMLADTFPEWGHKDPKALGGTPAGLHMYVEDVDAVYKKAIDAGAKSEPGMEVKDMFYGDRSGSIIDPFGHKWMISTHKEDVPWAEMQKRSDEMMKQHQDPHTEKSMA